MAHHIIDKIPISHSQISQRIIACQMKLALEYLPIWSEALLHKQVVHTVDKQYIEKQNDNQSHDGLDALLRTDLKEF